jgi:hypothetical protein
MPNPDYVPGAIEPSKEVSIPILPGPASLGTRVLEVSIPQSAGSDQQSTEYIVITHGTDTTPPYVVNSQAFTQRGKAPPPTRSPRPSQHTRSSKSPRFARPRCALERSPAELVPGAPYRFRGHFPPRVVAVGSDAGPKLRNTAEATENVPTRLYCSWNRFGRFSANVPSHERNGARERFGCLFRLGVN